MILILDSKRRLTIPTSFATAKPGDRFVVEFDAEEDDIVFRRMAKRGAWLDVLKSCPISMDDLPKRAR